ncbi:MAG: hypothetical protein V8S98_00460, partial [Lachnospiraceae bacterium]
GKYKGIYFSQNIIKKRSQEQMTSKPIISLFWDWLWPWEHACGKHLPVGVGIRSDETSGSHPGAGWRRPWQRIHLLQG